MSFKVMYFIVVSLCYIIVTCQGNVIDEYSWRDYSGVTPIDAFKAGVDRNGKPIYIGQVLHDNKLIPGEIYENSSEIHIEFGQVHVLKLAIKMLCSPHHEIFEWIKTRYDNVFEKRNNHILFEGGYEKGFTTYIGRAISQGELTVGKVICHGSGCYKLTTIENGKWYEHDVFEVLTYNLNAKIKPPATTSTTTTLRPAVTFYTEVYRKVFPSTTYPNSKSTEKYSPPFLLSSTTNYVSAVLNHRTTDGSDPTVAGYNSGVYGTVSGFLCVLLIIIHCSQIYQ